MHMKTVAELLKSKSVNSVFSIAPDASVLDAVKLMAEKNIGALLITKDGELVGIFTERDYSRKLVLAGLSSKDTPVRDVMTANVMYVRPTQTNEECMALMTENRMRHLPVMDNGRLLGLLSIGDLVKDIMSEQQFTIKQLEHYISGQGY